MTWSVAGRFAAKVGTDPLTSICPVLTTNVDSSEVRAQALLLVKEQYISASIFASPGTLPINIIGTKITVEATNGEGAQSPASVLSGELNNGSRVKFGARLLCRPRDIVDDAIKVTVDWVIERKATIFTPD